MKLIRFGNPEEEKTGVILPNGNRLDVSAFGEDFDEQFFGSKGPKRLSEWLLKNESNCAEISNEISLGSPIARPSKIV